MASDAENYSVIRTAFDTIDHKVLLNGLKALSGVRLVCFLLTFCVRPGKCTSSIASLTCGAPQGSAG